VLTILVSCTSGSRDQQAQQSDTTSDNSILADAASSPDGNQGSESPHSFESLINFVSRSDIQLPYGYCALLNIEPRKDGFRSLMEVTPLDNSNYLLALKEVVGCPATDCQAQVTLVEFNSQSVTNRHTFEISYQTEPQCSLQHGTFFLMARELREYEENDVGAMNDTGKPPVTQWDCRVFFNGKISPLSDLTKSELLLCRNLIFAKHGYVFKLDSLKQYFSAFSWYKPNSSNTNIQLTAEDKVLLDLITGEEARRK